MKKISLVIVLLFISLIAISCANGEMPATTANGETSAITESSEAEETIQITESVENTLNNVSGEKEKIDIEVFYCYNVQNDGAATVDFTMMGDAYTGVVNSKGEIIYYAEEDIELTSVGKNYGVIYNYEKHGLINYETGETSWFEDGVFDELIGCGDGLLLTYKDQNTTGSSEHIYTVIDVTTGKIVKQNTASLEFLKRKDYIHIGDGWFLSQSDNKSANMYDSNNNYMYQTNNFKVMGRFIDSKIYMDYIIFDSSSYLRELKRIDSLGAEKNIDVSSSANWIFDQSGSVEKTSRFTNGATGLLINYHDVEYLQVIDTVTNTTYEYKRYPREMLKGFFVYDNYCLVIIKDADGKDFFTLLNTKGEEMFDPIRKKDSAYNVNLSGERLILRSKSQESVTWDTFKVFDLNGKQLFTLYGEGYEFINGAAWRDGKLIDKFGNEIEITMKK